MIADVIRNPRFSYFFSFMLGVGLVVIILHKDCNSNSKLCQRYKSPSLAEIKDSIYIIGTDCYKFKDVQIKCPTDTSNLVEPFKIIEKNPYDRQDSSNITQSFNSLKQTENIIETFKSEFNSRSHITN